MATHENGPEKHASQPAHNGPSNQGNEYQALCGQLLKIEEMLRQRADEVSRVSEQLAYDSDEHRRLQSILRFNEQGYRTFVDFAGSIILHMSLDGRILYMNPFGQRFFGFELQELLGRPVMGTIVPEKESGGRDLRPLMEEILRNPEKHVYNENENVRKNGERVWVAWANGFIFDATGKPIEVISVGMDITRRKCAEDDLCESEEKFHALAENANVLIGIVQKRKYVYVNPWLVAFTGYTREQLLEIGVETLIRQDHRAMVVDYYDRRLRGEPVPSSFEFVAVTRSGEERWLSLANARVVLQGEPSVISVGYDITERKMAEEALRASRDDLERRVAERTNQLRKMTAELARVEHRERRRMAAIIHENLQQLIVGARMQLDAVINRIDSPDLQADARRVADLLPKMLEISRGLTLELSPPVLNDGGLGPALKWLGHRMEEQMGLTVTVDAPGAVHIDDDIRALLFEAVRELLVNIVKYAGVRLASVQMEELPNQVVRITVSDNGAGFDPIQAMRRADGGFGLLRIRDRIELVGGTMGIDSAPGRGTRITLEVPAHVPSDK